MSEYVVVDKEQLEADLTTVADSIRAKSGTSEKLEFPLGMKSAVENINTAKEEQEKTIDITKNGTTEVTPDEGKVLSKVTVNVEVESGGGAGDIYELFNSIMNKTIEIFNYTEEINWGSETNFGCLFNECSQLKKWAVPNLTWYASGYMFRYCKNLVYIDVGKPSEMHYGTFYGISLNGVSLVIRSETPPTLSGAFIGTSFDTTTSIYVPKNSIDLYKTTTNWTTYSDCYKAIEDYPEITGGII